MTLWEYSIFTLDLAKPDELGTKLDALGLDGWELVAVFPASEGHRWVQAFFKRPREPGGVAP